MSGSSRWWHVCAAVACIMYTSSHAEARTIRMTVGVSAVAVGEDLRVTIDTRNEGDEPAIEVIGSVVFRGLKATAAMLPALQPSESATSTVLLRASGLSMLRGVWPLVVRVAYADANHQSFDALHVSTVAFGPTPPEHALMVSLTGGRLGESRQLTANVDVAGRPTQVRLTFLGPTSLVLVPESSELPPDLPRRIAVIATAINKAATPSSRLPVFAVAEYEAPSGVHDTIVAGAMLETAAGTSPIDANVVLGTLLLALLATWLVFVVRGRRRMVNDGE